MGNFQDGGENRSFLVEMIVKTDVVTQVLFINCEFHSNTGEAKWFFFNSVSLFCFSQKVAKRPCFYNCFTDKNSMFLHAQKAVRADNSRHQP